MISAGHCALCERRARSFLARQTAAREGGGGENSMNVWRGSCHRWEFERALGEMRGVFGVHAAQIAVRYGIDVPDELAIILPAIDSD